MGKSPVRANSPSGGCEVRTVFFIRLGPSPPTIPTPAGHHKVPETFQPNAFQIYYDQLIVIGVIAGCPEITDIQPITDQIGRGVSLYVSDRLEKQASAVRRESRRSQPAICCREETQNDADAAERALTNKREAIRYGDLYVSARLCH